MIFAVVAELLQANVIVPVPPVADELAVPLVPPLQLMLVLVMLATTAVAGSVMVTASVSVHPLASVTVTV